MERYSLDRLIHLSEQHTPILCPPEMELTESIFFQKLTEEIARYNLPIISEEALIDRNRNEQPQRQLLLSAKEGKFRFLKVLVNLQKFGHLAYVERVYILLPPNLPPQLKHNSKELPPRIYSNSPELPPHEGLERLGVAKNKDSTFISETHKARLLQIEQRRVERMNLITQRQKQRQELMHKWSEELDEIIENSNSPSVIYLKDSIDLMIKVIVSKLEQQGAKMNTTEEQTHNQEELKAAKKKLYDDLQ